MKRRLNRSRAVGREPTIAAMSQKKRQYKPIGFGDPPDSRTVEGKLIAAAKAAETRHLRRIQRDYEEFEQDRNSWPAPE
jgi:hypothetical protein